MKNKLEEENALLKHQLEELKNKLEGKDSKLGQALGLLHIDAAKDTAEINSYKETIEKQKKELAQMKREKQTLDAEIAQSRAKVHSLDAESKERLRQFEKETDL